MAQNASSHGFSIGDVVTIKTGGPPMTILDFVTACPVPGAECRWYEGMHRQQEVIPFACLVHAKTWEPTV